MASQPNPYAPINTLAITTFVISVLLGPVAILLIPFGHLSLRQIRRTAQRGDELALIGLVLGYLWLASLVFIVVVGAVLLVVAL
jgi:peptidyl-prolyl cis-trans isomerase B (cyclophilin B)